MARASSIACPDSNPIVALKLFQNLELLAYRRDAWMFLPFQSKPTDQFCFSGRNMLAAIRVTMRRGTILCACAPR
jgi:hypothetical protein